MGFLEGSTGARALEGCWSMLTRSSTRRLEARGATPGRVTVHCWSRVALLRDCEAVRTSIGRVYRFLHLRVLQRHCRNSNRVLLRRRRLLSDRGA